MADFLFTSLLYKKLVELEFFMEYFKFLHTFCETKVYPTQQQLERILDENRLTALDLFFSNEYGLFVNLPETNVLEEQTQVALIDVLCLELKKCYFEKEDKYSVACFECITNFQSSRIITRILTEIYRL
jgi:hypothetical protein